MIWNRTHLEYYLSKQRQKKSQWLLAHRQTIPAPVFIVSSHSTGQGSSVYCAISEHWQRLQCLSFRLRELAKSPVFIDHLRALAKAPVFIGHRRALAKTTVFMVPFLNTGLVSIVYRVISEHWPRLHCASVIWEHWPRLRCLLCHPVTLAKAPLFIV
jgi:hypothetical protein